MSFSQVMDEMIPIKPTYEFEGPTRPVTPSNDNPSRNPYLYHSESVAKALNQLSRDLSGMCDSNTLVAARDDDIPLLNNANNERPAASQQISCHLQVPETPGVPRSPAPAQATHVATSPTTTTIPSAAQSRLPPKRESIEQSVNLYSAQGVHTTIDPLVLSPQQTTPNSISAVTSLRQSPSGTTTPLFPTRNAPILTNSSPSLSTPASKVFSPTPSTPDLLPEDAETEDEDKTWQPASRHLKSMARSVRPPASRVMHHPPSVNLDRVGPITAPVASTSSSPYTHDNTVICSVSIAPDAEANSDYQGGISERSASRSPPAQQAGYSGGPSRERGKNRRGSGGNHPYKPNKQVQSLGTGRQVCTYVSPYDGWECEQVLGRSYDVPRHMEVHAKEEYELVLTGKLDVQHSTLFATVTEANVYVCLVCRKDFSRKDAMQRHIRNASKMSKAKHRAEMKASLKKRMLGIPLHSPPNAVPLEILERHRSILEKLRVEAVSLGQDVSDWDVENMIPQAEVNVADLSGTPANAPGIPVGRRGAKPKADEPSPEFASRPTRSSNRLVSNIPESAPGESGHLTSSLPPPSAVKVRPGDEFSSIGESEKLRSIKLRAPKRPHTKKGPTRKQTQPASSPVGADSDSELSCDDRFGLLEEEDPMNLD